MFGEGISLVSRITSEFQVERINCLTAAIISSGSKNSLLSSILSISNFPSTVSVSIM